MEWYLLIIFGTLSIATFIFIARFLYFLVFNPLRILEMNYGPSSAADRRSRHQWKKHWDVIQLLGIFILFSFAMFQLAFHLLAWMPGNWGHIDDGEWVTAQHGLSVTFAAYATLFFGMGIGKAVRALINEKILLAKIQLLEKIDRTIGNEGLTSLKSEFDDAISNGVSNGSRSLASIDKVDLPWGFKEDLLRDASNRIVERLKSVSS